MGTARNRVSNESKPEVNDLFLEIANSDIFQRAPVMRTLLIYLWDRRGTNLSEYAIAVEGLHRPASFDPRIDSTARVQVARLRAKLKIFYESAGDQFPLRICIPHGKHELESTFERPSAIPISRPRPSLPRYAAVTIVALAAACIALGALVLVERRPIGPAPLPLAGLWQSFMANGKPVEIVIPSPMFFHWERPNITVRAYSITEFPKWPDSPPLLEFGAKWGPPTVYPLYVGAPEMSMGLRILQYLEKRGSDVDLVESRKLAADAPSSRNTIFIGMPRTANYLDPMTAKANFYIESVEPDVIGNRAPVGNEPKEFREVSYAANRAIVPAIITLLPKRPEGTRSLLLLARRLSGMSSILLSPSGLREIDTAVEKSGSPDSWEMVINAEIQDDTVLRVWPVATRAVPASYWK